MNFARPRPPLGSSGGGGSYGGGSSRRERDICRDYQRGSCTRGDQCRYSHDDGGYAFITHTNFTA